MQVSIPGPVLFSLCISDLPASLPSSISCFLYADDLAIWSSCPFVLIVVDTTQEPLIPLECWCLSLNPSKCEASLFSVDSHQDNLQLYFFLFNSRLCFNPSWGPSKESLSLLYKAFLWSHLTYASPRLFPFLSFTNFTKWQVEPSPAASRPSLSHFSSLRLFYLPYE